MGDINKNLGDINKNLGDFHKPIDNPFVRCYNNKYIIDGVVTMNLIKIEDNKNNMVVKHWDLAWEARYRLSSLGLKVVSVLISMINVNDEDFKPYTLKINDFKELIHSNSKKVYEYVNIMTDELMKKPFKIGDEKFNWVYYAKYQEGDNYVTLKIAPELKPYLLALQGKFIEYNIINILPLKSNYVIRFYELLKSKWKEYKHYKKDAKSYTFEIRISWLREHFEIPTSYQYSSHIKKLIIEKAKKQFKQRTDIKFDYKEDKIGRRVDRIIVTVRDNNKGSNDYLKDLKSFISFYRANKINKTLYQDEKLCLSVSEQGRLYDKNTLAEYDKDDAMTVWKKLYERAKKGELSQ